MLKPESKQAVSNFFAAAETEFNAFLKARSPEEYEAAAQLILDSQAKGGRLHVTGIGKCSHVSTYAASLFSSPATPPTTSTAPRPSTAPAGSWRPGTWSSPSPIPVRPPS